MLDANVDDEPNESEPDELDEQCKPGLDDAWTSSGDDDEGGDCSARGPGVNAKPCRRPGVNSLELAESELQVDKFDEHVACCSIEVSDHCISF